MVVVDAEQSLEFTPIFTVMAIVAVVQVEAVPVEAVPVDVVIEIVSTVAVVSVPTIIHVVLVGVDATLVLYAQGL